MDIRTVTVVVIAGVAIGSLVPVAQADSFDGLQNSTEHGYENGTMGVAFSLDQDVPANHSSSRQYDGDTGVYFADYDGSGNSESGPPLPPFNSIGNHTDVTYNTPPDTYHNWNRYEVSNFSVGDSDTSRYPSSAETVDDEWVQDAHSTKFWHAPSTTVRLSNEKTVQYIPESGTVYGVVDYRLKSPVDDRDGGDGVKVYRTIDSHKIESVCLIEGRTEQQIKSDPDPCSEDQYVLGKETSNMSHPSIEYTARGASTEERTYHLVADIHTEIEVVRWVEVEYEVCNRKIKPDGSIVTICTPKTKFEKEDTSIVEKDTITTDSWDIKVYDTSNFQVSRSTDENKTEIWAESKGQPWAGLNVSGTQFSTGWRFYTRRDTGWDTVTTTSTDDGSSSTRFETVPVKTYAYPSSRGTSRVSQSPTQKVFLEGTLDGKSRSSPTSTIDDNVSVDVAKNNSQAFQPHYNQTRGLQVKALGRGANQMEMAGIVHGEQKLVSETALTRTVEQKESELSVSVIEANGTHVALNITLQTLEGEPINLVSRNSRGRDGGAIHLPNGDSVLTGENGRVTVTFEGPASGTVRFKPASWRGQSVAYESSIARYSVAPFTSVEGVITLFLSLFAVTGPVLVTMYLLDDVAGIDTWPPHKR
ncbi:hypothetical protein [Haloarcula sp. Atlit-7R]|uniref:hypothetical protein n=1 Tax=Haloarcula sp. Atlit-7R TaxID=2282125 RepID=UPI000EF14F68|nr:hypothetical protein [Haloarcula sp. Atlit-7R]RLM94338.1 hypothetical protein D3D01_15870 [Haloarcula sp. Atlit-7R]